MGAATIEKESIGFLKKLSKNNNRDWFNSNKDKYIHAHNNIIAFADTVIRSMNKHDEIETTSGKQSLMRIYKDVRFSKDKKPYNTHWSGSMKRATKKLRGGYYFHIEPGNTFIAGGFFGPEPHDLKRIRQDIDLNYKDWQKMLHNKTLVKSFGKMRGAQIVSAPRGYAKDHPGIDLLRYKQFIFRHDFTDEELYSADFAAKMSKAYKNMRPFLDFMSEVLTTDLNGVSIIS